MTKRDKPIVVYVAAVLFCIATLVVFGCLCGLVLVTVQNEGYRAYSPIMMFQGAPKSHYEQEHTFSYGIVRLISTPLGMIVGSVFLLATFLAWARVMISRKGRCVSALLTLGLIELTLALLNIPLSAATAFHHSGWGLPCNNQWFGSFIAMNFVLSPVIIHLVGSLATESNSM